MYWVGLRLFLYCFKGIYKICILCWLILGIYKEKEIFYLKKINIKVEVKCYVGKCVVY